MSYLCTYVYRSAGTFSSQWWIFWRTFSPATSQFNCEKCSFAHCPRTPRLWMPRFLVETKWYSDLIQMIFLVMNDSCATHGDGFSNLQKFAMTLWKRNLEDIFRGSTVCSVLMCWHDIHRGTSLGRCSGNAVKSHAMKMHWAGLVFVW